MAHQMQEHGDEGTWVSYDDRGSAIMAFLAAILVNVAIVGIFLFFTWLTYATQ